jgi:hypothetical protein
MKEPVRPKLASPHSEKSCLTYSRIALPSSFAPEVRSPPRTFLLRRQTFVNYELLITSYQVRADRVLHRPIDGDAPTCMRFLTGSAICNS